MDDLFDFVAGFFEIVMHLFTSPAFWWTMLGVAIGLITGYFIF